MLQSRQDNNMYIKDVHKYSMYIKDICDLYKMTKLSSFEELLKKDGSVSQKQPSRGVLRKRCSENTRQIYWRKPMLKCDFNKVALHGCSPVNLLHIFRTPFPKNTSGQLLQPLFIIETSRVLLLRCCR